jgi:LPS-assembly protein
MVRASPVGGLGIQWQADYDPKYGRIVDTDFAVDYRWAGKYHVSAGHDEVRTPIAQPANQFRARFDYGDANRRGVNAGVETVYDYREGVLRYVTAQVTYNTDCCGLSVQYREYSTGIGVVPQFRIAFSIANLGTFGTLRKQDRLF